MKKDALIDQTGLYRYSLHREWDAKASRVVFIMLNPSRADAITDDPTIRRCISFAKSWGYGSLEVVNLFAYRTSDPKELKTVTDPIGPNNDHYLERAAKSAEKIIVAWGNYGILKNRSKAVVDLLIGFGIPKLYCLGTTQSGCPFHPLYRKASTNLIDYYP